MLPSPTWSGTAANARLAVLAIRCMSARPAVRLTPLRRRTKTRLGPLSVGSGLSWAFW